MRRNLVSARWNFLLSGFALPGVDAAAPFNPSLVPAVKLGVFGIQHTPPGAPEEGFDMTMVVPASGTITDHGPGDQAEPRARLPNASSSSLIHELLGPPTASRHRTARAHRGARRRGQLGAAPRARTTTRIIRRLNPPSILSGPSARRPSSAGRAPPPMVRVQSLKIPARLLSRVRPGDVLTLSPSPLPDGTTPISTRVVAREEFRIGRSPVDADLVTWFQPRNAENDETHPPPEQGALLFAAARRTPDGARLRQFQRHGAGWTSPLHRDTATGEPPARKRRHLARHALCHRFPLAARLASGRPQIDNLPQWAGAATAASGSSPGSVVLDPAALGGLVFEPRSPATMRRAVWLLSGLSLRLRSFARPPRCVGRWTPAGARLHPSSSRSFLAGESRRKRSCRARRNHARRQ